MGQIKFSTLSESQRIELCKQYGINPNDADAEVKINNIFLEAEKDKRIAKAHSDTDKAHSVFLAYEEARGQRLTAQSRYMDLKGIAEQRGEAEDSSEMKTARHKFLTTQKSENELYSEHDILASRALNSCFYAMG